MGKGACLPPLHPPPCARAFRPCVQEGAEHSHDSNVTSVGIEAEGELSYPKVQGWLSNLLRVGRRWRTLVLALLVRLALICTAVLHGGCAACCCARRSSRHSTHAWLGASWAPAPSLRMPCSVACPISCLQEKGADIFRSKGIMCLQGSDDK